MRHLFYRTFFDNHFFFFKFGDIQKKSTNAMNRDARGNHIQSIQRRPQDDASSVRSSSLAKTSTLRKIK